jgi:hypothetical protein
MQDIQQYGAWRAASPQALEQYRGAVAGADLLDAAPPSSASQRALARLRDDRLSVAFVAEFSRGKSELINAIFFADYGQRILPSSPGRTTMCPTELPVRPACRPASACCRSKPAPAPPPATSARTPPPGPCCRSTSTRRPHDETFRRSA